MGSKGWIQLIAISVDLSFLLRKEINVHLVLCVANQLIFANLYHVTRSTGSNGGDYNRLKCNP